MTTEVTNAVHEYTVSEMFEEESKRFADGYKTGYFTSIYSDRLYKEAEKHDCLCLGSGTVTINWYVTRGAKREPVIRIEYMETTYASRKRYKNGFVMNKKCWGNTRREAKFPFTEEGLTSALEFAGRL